MSEWINLVKNVASPTQMPQPDVHLNVLVSPYHVPEAMRGIRLADGRFRVEFRYIDGEERQGKAIKLDDHATAFEGRITRRLLAIELDVAKLGARTVGVSVSTAEAEERIKRELDGAFEKLIHANNATERLSATRAQDAFQSRRTELLQQLVGSG
jgi:hypothetical protein